MLDDEYSLKKWIDRLQSIREETSKLFDEVSAILQSDNLLSAADSENAQQSLSAVLEFQNNAIALIPENYEVPTTISGLIQVEKAVEQAYSLVQQVEHVNKAIQAFRELQCSDEDAADEFVGHQEVAGKKAETLTDEELVEEGQIYVQIVECLLDDSEQRDTGELYKRITKMVGYATRVALENGWLSWPEGSLLSNYESFAYPIGLSFSRSMDSAKVGIHTKEEKIGAEEANVEKQTLDVALIQNEKKDEILPDPKSVKSLSDIKMKVYPFSNAKYHCVVKKKNPNSFSTNKFETDLKQVSIVPRMAVFALCELYQNGIIIDKELEKRLAISEEEQRSNSEVSVQTLRSSLQKLRQKGYVIEHEILFAENSKEPEVFYTLSAYGAAAFCKDSSRKFLQTRSPIRLLVKNEENPWTCSVVNPVSDLVRAGRINAALYSLEQMFPKRFSAGRMMSHTFLSREILDKISSHQYCFVSGMIDARRVETDLQAIREVLSQRNDVRSILLVDSEEEAKHWAASLDSKSDALYFWFEENGEPVIVDALGDHCMELLFESAEANIEETAETMKATSISEEAEENPKSVSESSKKVEEPPTYASEERLKPFEEPSFESEIIEEFPIFNANLASTSETEEEESIQADDLQKVVFTAMEEIDKGSLAEGMLLLHAAAEHSKEARLLRDKVSFVLGDPLCPDEDWHMLADQPVALGFGDFEALDDSLNAAIWLKIFFEPETPNDYRLKNRWKQINSDLSSSVMEQFPAIKQLISYFWTFIVHYHIGIKYCASSDVRDQIGINRKLAQAEQQLEEMLDSVFARNVASKFGFLKVKQLTVHLYGNNGVMTKYLQEAPKKSLDSLSEICREFTDQDLSLQSDILDLQPQESKLEQFIDYYWISEGDWAKNDKSNVLTGDYRKRMLSWIREASQVLLRYYECRRAADLIHGTVDVSPEVINKTRTRLEELFHDAEQQIEAGIQGSEKKGYQFILVVIHYFQSLFKENFNENQRYFYESFLMSDEIELDDDYLPISDENWLEGIRPVKGHIFWERLLRHSQKEHFTWEVAARSALLSYDVGAYQLIAQISEQKVQEEIVEETSKKLPNQLIKYNDDFRAEVELAQNYGQMASNEEMYHYIKLAEAAKKHAEKTKNAGYFKRLLDRCREQILQNSDSRMEATRTRLEALKRDTLDHAERDDDVEDEEVLRQWPILEKIEQALNRRNMTVAEDYIQLAAKGQKDTPSIQIVNGDTYQAFIDKYQMLYNECSAHKGEDLNRLYEQSVRNLLFPNQTNRNTANAQKFIQLWNKTQPKQIGEFMEQLLFRKVDRVEAKGEKELYVFPAAREVTEDYYPHPFKEFGTEAVRKGVRILMLAGVRTADTLLEDVMRRSGGNGSATIVILDYALPLADRKMLAKSIKLRSIREVVVVIDRVMALFLAGTNQSERANAFLKVALPSSRVQPYIPVGSIPPEMFIGRADELDKIRSMNGPILVYGGRQLGKTALLRESKNREHDPQNGRYAIFVELRERGVEASLEAIVEELVNEHVLEHRCGTWDELKSALRMRFSSANKPVHKLMLLLDEADAFLADCENHQNRPLEILKELKDASNERFKFVLAGLRDVVRFDKRRLGGNTVLAHLGHITIRPLEYLDARDLLLRPLEYLGFRIESHGEDIISLILAKTNYYPGLIHLYCQKLIEAITESYRNGNYNESLTPPYLLDEKHIKTLLGQKELLSEIENKFRITLQLDADNLYDILAKVIAYRYYDVGIGIGSSAKDVVEICQEFNIDKISGLPEDSVSALLEEMDELNILRREASGSENYVFNRYSFFQMLGSNQDELFEELYMLGEN